MPEYQNLPFTAVDHVEKIISDFGKKPVNGKRKERIDSMNRQARLDAFPSRLRLTMADEYPVRLRM